MGEGAEQRAKPSVGSGRKLEAGAVGRAGLASAPDRSRQVCAGAQLSGSSAGSEL